jgi:hypothetical protein
MAAAPYPAYHGASPMPENGIKKSRDGEVAALS